MASRKLCFFICLFAVAPATAAELRPYASADSLTYTQPIAIKSMLHDWQPPFVGGDTALSYDKLEIGIQWNDWQLGLFERHDYQLAFSPDTAEIVYLTENHLPLPTGRDYELRIHARNNVSRGLRAGFHQTLLPTLNFGLAVSYLQGVSLTDGQINGTASVIAANDYDFHFDTRYHYSRDVLFERSVSAPSGQGYSLDLHLDWRPNQRFNASLDAIDLAARIYWRNAPVTDAVASSATKSYDEDGYVRYEPAISGREAYENFTQTLPRKLLFNSQYHYNDTVSLLAEWHDYGVADFVNLGLGWQQGLNGLFQTLYNPQTQALILRYRNQALSLELGSDQLDPARARFFSLQFSYHQRF